MTQSLSLDDQAHLIMKQKVAATTIDQQVKESTKSDDRHKEDDKNYYDKNISFFDRISCEANDKQTGKPKNWKEERKMNAETFGLQQRMQSDLVKSNYYNNGNSRQYNNSNNNYRGSNQNGGNQSGRNYPRQSNQNNLSNNRSNNNNGGMSQRYNNNNSNGQRVAVGGNMRYNGSGNNGNMRRNEMEVSYNSMGQRNGGGSRRFGSR